MSGVPLLVEAAGLQVLIVGGGAVAARKAAVLHAAGATVLVVAPELCDAMSDLVLSGGVTVERRRYRAADIGSALLVIAATDDRAVNAAVAADARAACRMANVVDATEEGTFATMATHRAGMLVVGVSAGVPAGAARIRDAIAERFDERYASALAEMGALRDRLLADGRADEWRRASAAVTDAAFCEAVETGTLHERMPVWR